MSDPLARTAARQTGRGAGLIAFALLATFGLYYVKWAPSYDKALLVGPGGRIGPSILSQGRHMIPSWWQAAWQYALAYGRDIWKALVLGLLLGAGVQALVPASWIRRFFGRAGYASITKAGLVSVPSMMCTCCAAPVAVGLKQAGASAAAALAYWLGNPLLNPATLVLIAFVLGWKWMVLRLMFGLLLVFGLSYVVNQSADLNQLPSHATIRAPFKEKDGTERSVWLRWWREFWRLSISLVPEYVVLVFLLGAAHAWLSPVRGPGAIHGLLWTVALACGSTLFVIPTAAEIPIVQTVMAAGLGAGPAAALLITLPAVSLPSLAMMAKVLPSRVLISVALVAAAAGVLAGAAAGAFQF